MCQKLASNVPSELLIDLEGLQQIVLRCGGALSSQSETTPKAGNTETSLHVHKLKTQVTTLLNGKTSDGRLVATVLIRGIVDVGGWEVLKGIEPWVRGLLAMLVV